MPKRGNTVAVIDESLIEKSLDDSVKGRAIEGKLYIKTCPVCKESISFVGNDIPKICPHCGLAYWFKPKDERGLFTLQDKYLNGGRKSTDLGPMYLEMKRYTENILKGRARKKKAFSKAFLEEKSIDATNRLMERYLKEPNFYIRASFGMMLSKSLGSMYNKKDLMIDQAVSLDQSFFENGSKLVDNLSRLKLGAAETFYQRSSKNPDENQNTVVAFCDALDKIHSTIREQQGPRNAILFLAGIRLQLFARRPAHAAEKFYSTFGSNTRDNIERAELLLRDRVKEGALS
jgi:hypothetical protein